MKLLSRLLPPQQVVKTEQQRGFTLIELVVVLILIGILAAYAAPRFTGRGGYSELAVRQDLKQSIRYAQQLAMSRTDHTISLVTGVHSIDVKDNGNSILGTYPKNISVDVTLDVATLTFNRLGAAAAGAANTQIVAHGTQQNYAVCITGTTGYAQDC